MMCPFCLKENGLKALVCNSCSRDIAVPATEPIIRSGGAMASSLEDQYQQGYTTTPEEIADVVALLPHLAIESEEWT